MVFPLLYLAPFFILFEGWQLVVAERYLGVKQLETGSDPRRLGPGEGVAFVWSAGIVIFWVWMLLCLFTDFGRAQVVVMLSVSVAGYSIRRSCALKWVLVVMTLEGAVRIGMMVSLLGMIWRAMA